MVVLVMSALNVKHPVKNVNLVLICVPNVIHTLKCLTPTLSHCHVTQTAPPVLIRTMTWWSVYRASYPVTPAHLQQSVWHVTLPKINNIFSLRTGVLMSVRTLRLHHHPTSVLTVIHHVILVKTSLISVLHACKDYTCTRTYVWLNVHGNTSQTSRIWSVLVLHPSRFRCRFQF